MDSIDDPKDIIENTIKEQLKTITGLGGHPNVNKKRLEESKKIKHFAISLTGEPTMYPKLGELIKKLHEKKITSFLVTNGQYPDSLEKLEKEDSLPTQIYLSLDAPTKEIYYNLDKPMLKDFWERFNRTLDIIHRIKDKTRTVLRITSVKHRNMCNEKDYAKLIEKANPKFLEIKGFTLLGPSGEKLTLENVPSHDEVKQFAKDIIKHCDYKLIDEEPTSRVVLLMKENIQERFLDS
jgi:tRNA wybutosine-synthesizing protein 1